MRVLPLSPIEYVFTGVGSQPITFVFHFSRRIHASALKKSLDKVLDAFPVLRSQLERTSDFEYKYVLCEGGCTFEEVETEQPFEKTDKATDYITPVQSLAGCPLTKIKLTQTPNGSVIGVSVSHALADGFSFFYLMVSWASLFRGGPFFKPYLEKEGILSLVKSSREDIKPYIIYRDCGLFYRDQKRKVLSGHPDIERFSISGRRIVEHIERGKRALNLTLTKNDVITAILWKRYLPLWNPEPGAQKTFMTCPFDYRRVKTGLPPNYFGCALCFTAASVDMEYLRRASVEDLALSIRRSVKAVNSSYVQRSLSTLENLRLQDGLDAMDKIHLRHPQRGMIVTNLTRMPLKEIDFGSGPPSSFLAYAEVHSSAAILPARDGVEVLIVSPHQETP